MKASLERALQASQTADATADPAQTPAPVAAASSAGTTADAARTPPSGAELAALEAAAAGGLVSAASLDTLPLSPIRTRRTGQHQRGVARGEQEARGAAQAPAQGRA